MFSLKIPLENFLNPYEVYFTEKDDTNFLTYGSSAKNLYLLLLEDL